MEVRFQTPVCVCGNVETDSVGKDLSKRAEVPSTFEINTMLALGTEWGCILGSFAMVTAFLYADLCNEEDGLSIATAPSILVRMGLVFEGIDLVLTKQCTV